MTTRTRFHARRSDFLGDRIEINVVVTTNHDDGTSTVVVAHSITLSTIRPEELLMEKDLTDIVVSLEQANGIRDRLGMVFQSSHGADKALINTVLEMMQLQRFH